MGALAIETASLTRRFDNIVAVRDLNLTVSEGSVYGFLGPNGAGKTTTIRMLLGLIRPNDGEINLFGASLASRRRAVLARIGSMVESPSLYPHLTGRENLEVTRRLLGVSRGQIDRALSIVKLEQDAGRLVKGYSLGMRQRLGLAIALLNNPALLILDEPTNGLDPAGIHEIRELIKRFAADHGITVFLSSHLLSEVELVATHIGIVERGSLLFQGTIEESRAARVARLCLTVEPANRAAQVIESVGWRIQAAAGGRLTVKTSNPNDVAAINTLLVQSGHKVFHLSLEQPSLEEMFLQLTNGNSSGGNRE